MAFKVLALASGVTGLSDHRVLNGAMMTGAGQLQVRSGVLPGQGGLDLSTVSAMVARVNPGKVLIQNTISSSLGPYLLVSDANTDITFDAGEAAVPRVDRIIARAYDNTNDGSGSTLGSIYYLKGTAGGSATALPANSVLLYEMTVPAGASAGGGGVNFANAVDQRAYTAAQGGMFPVASNTVMAAISNPWEGMQVYRTDLDVPFIFDGTTWRARGVANVASSANLTSINNPYDGLLAVVRDRDALYMYNGSAWVNTGSPSPLFYGENSTATSVPNGGTASILWQTEVFDTATMHSTVTNTDRIIPTVAGLYRVEAEIIYAFTNQILYCNVAIAKNGSTVRATGNTKPTVTNNVSASGGQVWDYMEFNGTTDYCTVVAGQTSADSLAKNTNVAAGLRSRVAVTYVRPLT